MRASDLSKSEKLFLLRKRAHKSMKQAAADYKVGLAEYRRWESGASEQEAPNVGVGSLNKQDVYIIHRRRSGKTVKELADKVGCCVWWFRQMEMGLQNDEKLQKLWGISKSSKAA